jgi:formate dehydrogenase major subunit
MGICPKTGPGLKSMDDSEYRSLLMAEWKTNDLPMVRDFSLVEDLKNYKIKNLFIFGEDPVGCAVDDKDVNELVCNTSFICVQDVFMTPTAKLADLVLPMNLPYEEGGSFTNTQKRVQIFEGQIKSPVDQSNVKILNSFMEMAELKKYETAAEVNDEIAKVLPSDETKLEFAFSEEERFARRFNHGCDGIKKMYCEFFSSCLKK